MRASYAWWEAGSQKRKLEAAENEQSQAALPKRRETRFAGATIEIKPLDFPIEKLPVEILARVAKHVPVAQWPSLERVNRKFRDAVHEAWRTLRKIHLEDDLRVLRDMPQFGSVERVSSETMTRLVLEKLTRLAANISDVGGFNRHRFDDTVVDVLARFEKLERIEFSSFNISLSDLEKFLKESASREKLKEINAANYLKHRTPPVQRPLFEAFTDEGGLAPLKLERLDLSNNVRFHFSWSFLNAVDVSSMTSFSVIDTHVSQSLFANFLTRATNLQRLSFSFDCYYDEKPWQGAQVHFNHPGPSLMLLQLNTRILEAVSKLEKLVSLKMNADNAAVDGCECRNFNEEMRRMLDELGRRGTLKELSLVKGHLATPQMASMVATALPNLHSFELCVDKCDDTALGNLLTAQKSLVDLHLYCDRSVVGLHTSIIPHLMGGALHLKHLRLNFSALVASKKNLSQAAAFRQLKTLSLIGLNRHIVDDTIMTTWADAFGSNLESLELPQSWEITDEGLLALIAKRPPLRELNLTWAQITDRSLKEMTTHCPKIRILNFSYCYGITETGAQSIVDWCTRLKQLHMAGDFRPWFPGGLRVEKYRKILFSKNEWQS